MNPNNEEPDPNRPFAYSADELPEYEGSLIGNAEGLEQLRDSIDRALERGEANIDEPGIEWQRVARLDRPLATASQRSSKDVALAIGCVTIILASMALVALGAIKLVEILS